MHAGTQSSQPGQLELPHGSQTWPEGHGVNSSQVGLQTPVENTQMLFGGQSPGSSHAVAPEAVDCVEPDESPPAPLVPSSTTTLPPHPTSATTAAQAAHVDQAIR